MPEFTHRDLRIFYREVRPPRRPAGRTADEGPALILVPESAASSASLGGELRYFGHRYHTLAIDAPGTGRSQRLQRWPDDWWSLTADAVAALAIHRGLGKVVVLGSSVGAAVALLTGLRHPSEVAAIVADSCPSTIPARELRREAGRRRSAVQRMRAWSMTPGPVDRTTRAVVAKQSSPVDVPDRSGPDLRTIVNGLSLAWFCGRAHGRAWPGVVLANSDLLERTADRGGFSPFQDGLSSLTCPVLLCGSEEDEWIAGLGSRLEAMAAAIPDSRVFLWPEGGHPLMWTAPTAFRRAADDFLETVAPAAHPRRAALDTAVGDR